MKPAYSVIIVAGGFGSRFGTTVPKQFLQLGEQTVIEQSVQQFQSAFPQIEIILVLPKEHEPKGKSLFADKKNINIKFAIGGHTRFHSVKNGLALVSKQAKVIGVHDAVRPLVSVQMIQNAFETAMHKGTAVPVIAVKDSIIKVVDGNNHSIARDNLFRVQTPQCFHEDILQKAYDLPYSANFTDDACVVEMAGYKINLVEGSEKNFKITTPPDLILATYYVNRESDS